jgi:hypothetical protein
MSSAPEDIERLAGMARLTGIPVRVSRAESELVQANRAETQA